MIPIEPHRRLACLAFSGELIADIIKPGLRTFRVESKVPRDAEFFSSYYDPNRRLIVVILEHPSFAPVLPGDPVPALSEEPMFYDLKLLGVG